MYLSNYYQLPVKTFKISGIETGNEIYKSLRSNGLISFYKPSANKIVILNSSQLSEEFIQKTLFSTPFALKYKSIYPKIHERGAGGNWQISFETTKPRIHPYVPPPGYIKQYFRSFETYVKGELPDNIKEIKRLFPISLNFDEHEITEMKSQISLHIVQAMQEVMTKKDGIGCFWYPPDFKNYVESNHIQVNFEFNKGHLNDSFFKKTSPFAFELIPGKKASEAIRSIFKGPSIVDCGNAVVICYYKALLEIIGDDKFDAYFTSNPFKPMRIQQCLEQGNCLIEDFCRFTDEAKHQPEGRENERLVEVGDLCGIEGIFYYTNKLPAGFGGSWNMIYAGRNEHKQQVFIAHGFKKPLTESGILDCLLEEYNRERTEEDLEEIKERTTRPQPDPPELYDPFKHKFLRDYYTISNEDIQKFSMESFSKGYRHSITLRLQAKYVLALLKTDDVPRIQSVFSLRRVFAQFAVFDGQSLYYK